MCKNVAHIYIHIHIIHCNNAKMPTITFDKDRNKNELIIHHHTPSLAKFVDIGLENC